ncbi:DoxX family protein [Afipia carboxidovorans]|uniref:DoxX family protein n=1 Tax=Afipia carboxidovorans TaxID=40137 RepID=UPI00308FDC51|nr:DoxX family membrane protein [Afipia carboxidovorans]
MPTLYVIGRVLFAILFMASGAAKLLDIPAAAEIVSAHLAIPASLSDIATQIEGFTGLPTAQLIVILGGILEVAGGVAIAANFGARALAVVLAIMLAISAVALHDVWNTAGVERTAAVFEILKSVALIGALLMIAGRPREAAPVRATYTDRASSYTDF